ncbi:hypothetical protein B0H10DRAFT_642189 [Mycena sp. CBHHK59/15]|nr:hypothetical protein B0H10DRAFT_642189 [Mycena sp. CBHHK59/15]
MRIAPLAYRPPFPPRVSTSTPTIHSPPRSNARTTLPNRRGLPPAYADSAGRARTRPTGGNLHAPRSRRCAYGPRKSLPILHFLLYWDTNLFCILTRRQSDVKPYASLGRSKPSQMVCTAHHPLVHDWRA